VPVARRFLAKRGDKHPHRGNSGWLARALGVRVSLPICGGKNEVESDGWL